MMIATAATSFVITLIDVLLFSISTGLAWRAAHHGPLAAQPISWGRFIFSLGYLSAYIVLLLDPDIRLAWSQFMQVPGLATIMLFWWWPSHVITKMGDDGRRVEDGTHVV